VSRAQHPHNTKHPPFNRPFEEWNLFLEMRGLVTQDTGLGTGEVLGSVKGTAHGNKKYEGRRNLPTFCRKAILIVTMKKYVGGARDGQGSSSTRGG